MTRKQIIKKAQNYHGDKLSFLDGAEWMQSIMAAEIETQLIQFKSEIQKAIEE